MLNHQLQKLAKSLSLTDFSSEEEPYILTKEEEDRAIGKAIESAQSAMAWKMRKLYATEDEIFHRIKLINWEEKIDRVEILARANMLKNHDLWHRAQRRKESEDRLRKMEELAETWTARRMYQLMSWTSSTKYNKKLVVNEGNKRLISALCFFVARDDRFESELGYNPQKGLLIRGATGIGKTFLVQCLSNNALNPIKMESILDITDQMRNNGDYKVDMGDCKLLYFDDVGTEESTVKHFGTNLMFFKNFIETYYLKNKTFNTLIASTNLNFKAMSDVYGFRVVSRLRDMFNVVDVSGEDMRGK